MSVGDPPAPLSRGASSRPCLERGGLVAWWRGSVAGENTPGCGSPMPQVFTLLLQANVMLCLT
ncbi:hypothetical protein E2C01_011516 [Portunus trituberculatus]|uniref:Uncharacterized protein n=1 Tax=Portunus trituberculatus TaxID=210409 RepID=A0A5B7DBZ8_PORTR|nr:hypothetical protein [Portunus trituberculatus]